MIQQKLKVQKYLPLIVSGCSGVGKGTLITNIIDCFPQLFELSVSYTTRQPRPGQIHGKHYFFVSRQQFQKLIKQGGFLEYCQVHGNYYGTSADYVDNIIKKGKICLFDIDIQGAEKVHAKHENWHYIFVVPPSIEQLQLRLRGRGTETEENIKKRIGNATKELNRLKQLSFYKVITNDNIQVCYSQFINYINQMYHLLIEVEK